MFGLEVAAVILAICAIAYISDRSKNKALRAAPHGALRVEALKAGHVNNTVQQYAAAGWQAVDQSTAKSLGSQARVTITFKKN
jgi:hypothetical protein